MLKNGVGHMRWIAALGALVALSTTGRVSAQTQGQAQPDTLSLKPIALPVNAPGGIAGEVRKANAPAKPPANAVPGSPALNYPVLDYATQVPVADTTSLLGLPQPQIGVPFAPAQISQQQTLALQMLTLPSNALAPHTLETLAPPVLSFAPRYAAQTPAPVGREPGRPGQGPTPGFYLPSPVMQVLPPAPLPQLTVAYIWTPLQTQTVQPGVYAEPVEGKQPPPIPTNLISLGASVLSTGFPGFGAFGAGVEGVWKGLGNIMPGVVGTPSTPQPPPPPQPTVPQPYNPGMRY